MNVAVYPPCWRVPLNPNHSVHPSRLHRALTQHPVGADDLLTLTEGGRTLQIPVFSAMGRILLMNAYGSLNSSQLGSKTGHSGGGLNSSGRGWLMASERPAASSDRVAQRRVNSEAKSCLNPACVPSDSMVFNRQRRQLTHTNTNTHTLARSLTHTHRCTVRRMFQGSEHVRLKN